MIVIIIRPQRIIEANSGMSVATTLSGRSPSAFQNNLTVAHDAENGWN